MHHLPRWTCLDLPRVDSATLETWENFLGQAIISFGSVVSLCYAVLSPRCTEKGRDVPGPYPWFFYSTGTPLPHSSSACSEKRENIPPLPMERRWSSGES